MTQQTDTEWPQQGDAYWYVDEDGKISPTTWRDLPHNFHDKSVGNTHQNVPKAHTYLNNRRAQHQWKTLAAQSWKDAGAVLDWEDAEQIKYYLFYSYQHGEWQTFYEWQERSQGTSYFHSDEAATAAMETLDEDTKYLLEGGE